MPPQSCNHTRDSLRKYDPTSPPAAAAAPDPPPSVTVSSSQSTWDMRKMMGLAGGSGLPAVMSRSDAAVPAECLPIASERAGGKSRSTAELTRSAAE